MEIPWYSEGLAFQCTQCGNCCSGPDTGYVWVEESEIEQLAVAMNMSEDIEKFERRFVRQIGLRKSLVEYSDGDCIFLDPDTRGCMVYQARPTQCRTWPFWDQNLKTASTWEKTAVNCPGCNRGGIYPLELIEEARGKKAI